MTKTNDKQSWKESSTVSIHQQIGFYNLYNNQIDRGLYNLYSFFQHSNIYLRFVLLLSSLIRQPHLIYFAFFSFLKLL